MNFRLLAGIALCAGLALSQFVPANPTAPVRPGSPAATIAADVPSRAELALRKFSACIAPNPEANVSLKVAREVKAKLAADGFDVRGGIWCNEMKTGAVGAFAVPESDLVGAGWPEDVPFNATIKGASNHHSVVGIKKQMDYGWGYWWWFGKYVVRMWW